MSLRGRASRAGAEPLRFSYLSNVTRRLLPGLLVVEALLDAIFASPRSRPLWAAIFIVSGFLGGLGYGRAVGIRAQFITSQPRPSPSLPAEPFGRRPVTMPFSILPVFAMGDPRAPAADIQQFAIFSVPGPVDGELVDGSLALVGRLSGTTTEGLWIDGILSGTAPHPPAHRGVIQDISPFNRAFPARLAECCETSSGTLTMSLADALAGSDLAVAELADNSAIAVVISDDFRVEAAKLSWCIARREEFFCGESWPEPYSPPSVFDPEWGGIKLPGT